MMVSILATSSADNKLLHGASSAMPRDLQATKTVHDDGSDYGEFTLDEEALINELLANIQPGNTTTVEPLVLTDIEDYEEPTGFRLSKTLGKELWVAPKVERQAQAKIAVNVTVEKPTLRDSHTFTKGTFLSFKG
jgi:hypothetical protein